VGSPLPTSMSGRGAPPPQAPLVILLVFVVVMLVAVGSTLTIYFPLLCFESKSKLGYDYFSLSSVTNDSFEENPSV
jgi:hypothetical protein